jgi:hypothetical protein
MTPTALLVDVSRARLIAEDARHARRDSARVSCAGVPRIGLKESAREPSFHFTISRAFMVGWNVQT